jgi:thymidylate synthase
VQGDFPLLTTKKINFDKVLTELLWFLRGDKDITWLQEQGNHIWDPWAFEGGTVGPMYGHQWRHWNAKGPLDPGIDQLEANLARLCDKNGSRRMLVTAWNPSDIPYQALPACHVLHQLSWQGEWVHMSVYQRSADYCLGVPYNIASYATLLRMYCHLARNIMGWGLDECRAGPVYFHFGDLHIYEDHIELAKVQLSRETRPLPDLVITNTGQMSFNHFHKDDFEIVRYNPWPHIPYAVHE